MIVNNKLLACRSLIDIRVAIKETCCVLFKSHGFNINIYVANLFKDFLDIHTYIKY